VRRVEAVRTLDAIPVRPVVHLQRVRRVDAFHDQRLAFQFDVAGDLGPETTVSGGDASCFERTPEGAGQSAPGRRDQIVDRGRIRREILRCNAVVLRHRTVHPERDRVVAPRQPSGPQRTPLPHDRHPRRVRDLTHVLLLTHLRVLPGGIILGAARIGVKDGQKQAFRRASTSVRAGQDRG
jgi:hypothetical protein